MIGTKLQERYELQEELGRGGMGVVYRARDPRLGREVAIKVLAPAVVTAESSERFQREARLVARLDHPAIVPIFDFGRHLGSSFYVMPVVEGITLDVLMERRSLVLGDTLEILALAADALDYSHELGVVHRDIKPSNLMVNRDAQGALRVRIMDFGLAMGVTGTRLTQTGALAGTITYLSPEQVLSSGVDGRADLYALATILFECLVGEPPFTGAPYTLMYRIGHEYPPSLEARGIDPALADLVQRCLRKDPDERPSRCGDLAHELRQILARLLDGGRAAPATSSSPPIASSAPRAVPFVGRADELSALALRLSAALAGECQLSMVTGEAGMGKSRMLDELAQKAGQRGVRVLRGRFADHESTFPFQAFCELVHDRLGQDGDPPDLRDLAGPLLTALPSLSELPALRQAAVAGGPSAAQGPGDRSQLFELIAQLLLRLSGGEPVMILLENLHHADASAEVLRYVVRRIGPTPTLIVGSFRAAEVQRDHPLARLLRGFEGDPCYLRVDLQPLGLTEHRDLIEAMLGRRLADDLAAQLFEATEGNPFFTEELVRTLFDAGSITPDDTGVMTLSGVTLSMATMPATIQQAIEARLRRLPEDLQQVLSQASVLGRRFDDTDLRALIGDEGQADEAIERLMRAGFLEEDGQRRGDGLQFQSRVVRDALHQRLPRRRRRRLHRKVAQDLEARYAGRLERVYPRLVHHYSEGDLAEKTIAYALRLARSSLVAFGAEEAVWAARVGLEFVEDDDANASTVTLPGTVGELRLLLASALRETGALDQALTEASRAVHALEVAADTAAGANAARLAAEVAWQLRRVEDARGWAEKGIRLARVAGPGDTLRKLLTLGATIANLRGQAHQARELLDEAEALRADVEVPEPAPEGGSLRTVLPHPAGTLDPLRMMSADDLELLANVFETLLRWDEDGHLVPHLCSSWAPSADGLSYRFSLRDEVTFSNGAPLDADTVRRAIERVIASRSGTARFKALRGATAWCAGETDRLEGIETPDAQTIVFHLDTPLAVFPALLTDLRTAIVHPAETGDALIGTGPFVFAEQDDRQVTLHRNPRCWRGVPRVEQVIFRTDLDAAATAAALRDEQLDLGRDLLPRDLEAMLREPRFSLIEATRKNVYFAAINAHGRASRHLEVRRALMSVRIQDLVWRTIGRFAQPANGLIPPGVLGHERRRRVVPPRERVLAGLRAAGLSLPIQLNAAVHPILRDRHGALTRALLDEWSALGLDVTVEDVPLDAVLARIEEPGGIDLWLGRWVLDYDDPDNVTHTLFHAEEGNFRAFRQPAAVDELMLQARSEGEAAVRQALYRRIENQLADDSVVLPLFHDIDYRLAGSRVRGLTLSAASPYVGYETVGKLDREPASSGALRRGKTESLHVAIATPISDLAPATLSSADGAEIASNVFEGLTRVEEGARVVPWLASSIEPSDGARRFTIRLRDDVRFHNGRQLVADDVRSTFEQVLRSPFSSRSVVLPLVGGDAFASGEASEIEGIRVTSATSLEVELTQPVPFFPALLSGPAMAIAPEGTERCIGNWRDDTAGTGPFRLVRLDSGKRIELEANPYSWRPGYPRSERLVFELGLDPQEAMAWFRRGRLAIADQFAPSAIEPLRQDAALAAAYYESPGFSTYFLTLNTVSGPFADLSLRRAFVQALDVETLVVSSLGRLGAPAHSLIPPGLLGHDAGRPRAVPLSDASLEGLELTAAAPPPYQGSYASIWQRLVQALGRLGVRVKVVESTLDGTLDAVSSARIDLAALRWIAAYPDADTFAGLLYEHGGLVGGFYRRADLNALFQRARTEPDAALRHGIYRELEHQVADEALLVPLFHEQVYRFTRPEVRGLRLRLGWPEVAYEELSLAPG